MFRETGLLENMDTESEMVPVRFSRESETLRFSEVQWKVYKSLTFTAFEQFPFNPDEPKYETPTIIRGPPHFQELLHHTIISSSWSLSSCKSKTLNVSIAHHWGNSFQLQLTLYFVTNFTYIFLCSSQWHSWFRLFLQLKGWEMMPARCVVQDLPVAAFSSSSSSQNLRFEVLCQVKSK